MKNYQKLEDLYGFNTYPKRDITIVKGKGAIVWDEKGKKYIDCVAGFGAALLGHSNRKVVKAIYEQAKKLISCPTVFYNDTRALLLEKLISIVPQNLMRAFLCNSGAEAIEGAIKFARYTTGKTDFVCAFRGFHGRTLGALSATHNPRYRKDFEPLVPGFTFVPFNNIESMEEAITPRTAGVILEIVQGEGGVYIANKDYLKKVRKLCDEKGILLIIDEIQTGFGRTGKMFAIEYMDVEADIMCVAKAIAGGIPMGAILVSSKVKLPLGKHGSTFGGNPLSCATAMAAIDFILERGLITEALEKGRYIMEKLKNLKLERVKEIRGLGLMIGIELKERAKPYLQRLSEKGVLVLLAGPKVIRLLPPLVISYEEIDFVVNKIEKVLSQDEIKEGFHLIKKNRTRRKEGV